MAGLLPGFDPGQEHREQLVHDHTLEYASLPERVVNRDHLSSVSDLLSAFADNHVMRCPGSFGDTCQVRLRTILHPQGLQTRPVVLRRSPSGARFTTRFGSDAYSSL